MSEVNRRDFFVKTEDGYSIAIREVIAANGADPKKTPIILLHGTRIPGLSEFDLDVPNGSFAADLAERGYACYIVDARGFGRSQRPAKMDEPPVPGARSLVRTIEIVRDLKAATDYICDAQNVEKVSLFGWGVGGTCCIMFAAMYPEQSAHILLYDVIYGGGGDYQIGFRFADPNKPGQFDQQVNGNYNVNTIELLESHWDAQIPIEDKVAWRDPAMIKAFSQALLDGDPKSGDYDPPSYRSPNGMLEDLFYMAQGRKLVHGNQVYCKVMIIRPELDTLCQKSDMDVLVEDLVNAEEVLHYAPENTTHYLLLDRPERGKNDLIARMQEFLA